MTVFAVQLNDKFLNILMFLILSLYVFFSFPVYSTGDGAELSAVGSTLGVAHPSGYPLYIQILNIISFIPVGNIAERMSIVSIIFSIISLYLIYLIIYKITFSKISSILSLLLIAFSYSFLGQSVVIKFYTLNLFLILLILYILIDVIANYDRRKIILASFLLGISASNHHTALFLVLPFIITIFFIKLKDIKVYFLSFIVFLIGFSINIFMFVRSLKENAINYDVVNSIEKFLFVYTRSGYSASSIDSVNMAVRSLDINSFLYPILNVFFLIGLNLYFFSLIFILIGFYLLFRKDKKVFTIIFTSFLLYSVFLAKMTFASKNLSINDYYIQGHQYFLPALALSTIISGITISFVLNYLKNKNFKPYKILFITTFFLVATLNVYNRFNDQNFFNNYVPYSYGKTILAITPLESVLLTKGDNITFEIWFLKRFSGFRNDICSLEYAPVDGSLYTRGCMPTKLYKEKFNLKDLNLSNLSEENRLFSTYPITQENFLKTSFKTVYVGLIYKITLKDKYEMIYDKLEIFKMTEPFVETLFNDCLNHNSDDFYTIELCKKIGIYYGFYGKLLDEVGDYNKSQIYYNRYFMINQKNNEENNYYGEYIKK